MNQEFNIISQRIRERNMHYSPEARTRTEMFIAKLRKLRDRYDSLMDLDTNTMMKIQEMAIRQDVLSGYARPYTNQFGVRFFKYEKRK